MRFLADENIPLPSIRALRHAGVDVHSVAELCAGASDDEVLELARRERRVLLTFDRDFGELVFRSGADGTPGVVYCRLAQQSPTELAELLITILLERSVAFEGQFTVLDHDHLRQRALPRDRNS